MFLAIYAIASAQDSSKQMIIDDTKVLYVELMQFKNDSKFHQVGFDRCCKYFKWLQKVKELENNPDSKLLLQEGVVVGDLKMLGLEYAKKSGKETNYTKFINQQFKEALSL
jgi:hypothetical protein